MTNWLSNLSEEVKNNIVAVVVIGGALLFVAYDKGCFHYTQPVAPVVEASTEQASVTASTDATTESTDTTQPAESNTH